MPNTQRNIRWRILKGKESWEFALASDRAGIRTWISLLPISQSSYYPWGATWPPVWRQGSQEGKALGIVGQKLYCWEALPCVSTVGSYIVDVPWEGVEGSQGVFISSIFFSLALTTPEWGYVVAPWLRECLGMKDHPGFGACDHCRVTTAEAGRMGWLWSSGMGRPELFLVWPEVTHTLYNPSPIICIQGISYCIDYIKREITLQITKTNLQYECAAVVIFLASRGGASSRWGFSNLPTTCLWKLYLCIIWR